MIGKSVLFLVAVAAIMGAIRPWLRHVRVVLYTRGRRSGKLPRREETPQGIMFGNVRLSRSQANQHFLFVGTSGSGKTLMQRRLMADVLRGITPGSDRRCLILDAKQDVARLLRHLGISCDVYSLDPLQRHETWPQAVAWDVAADICSPPRALNLAAALFPEESGGQNRYWTDAGRHVVAGLIESLIRHSAGSWTFADFIYALLSLDRLTELLRRDAEGCDISQAFLGEADTAYKVFTTIVSRIAYFRTVAALWQQVPRHRQLSIRAWLTSDSILLLGTNATIEAALDPLNELLFRIFVEDVDAQANSTTRETWAWIDEARLARALLRGERLSYFAVKARSKGGALVLSFQDIEGFRHACGSSQLADEIVAQCSWKMLGRMESEQSARWASGLTGQFETLEWHSSETSSGTRFGRAIAAQRVMKDVVLPAEFYAIPVPNRKRGVRAVFLSPDFAIMDTVRGDDLQAVVVPEYNTIDDGDATAQMHIDGIPTLQPWTADDRQRLALPPVAPLPIVDRQRQRLELLRPAMPPDHRMVHPKTRR